MSKAESEFQKQIKEDIEEMFPGSVVLKNDPNFLPGIPDLSIFYGKNWAMLETKKSENAPKRPNQEYYVNLTNSMSFARFICPENKEEIYNELQQAFKS